MSLFSYGTSNEFVAQWYGIPDPNTISYLQAEQSRFNTSMLPVSSGLFRDIANSVFQTIDYEAMLRATRAMARKMGTLFMENEVQYLSTIGELQHAPLIMQQWLMAEPLTRQMYFNQQLDGYSDTYRTEDKSIGLEHVDYCKVVDGLFLENESGDLVMHNIFGLYNEADNVRPLDITEQVDILDSWARLRAHLKIGKEDPTSKYNSML